MESRVRSSWRAVASAPVRIGFGILVIAYSPLGWCPPIPSLLPYPVVFQFERTVASDRSAVLAATVLLSPYACFDGPSCPPMYFGDFPIRPTGDWSDFLIDATRTTCVRGVLVTTTSGCTIAVIFAPRSPGAKAATLDVDVYFDVGTQFGTTLVLSGTALPVPVLRSTDGCSLSWLSY